MDKGSVRTTRRQTTAKKRTSTSAPRDADHSSSRNRSRSSGRGDAPDGVTEQDVRDCALLGMTFPDAATALKITEPDLRTLFGRPAMAAAWKDGRRVLEQTLHAKLIERALDGHVSALRLALSRIDQTRAEFDVLVAQAESAAKPKPKTPRGPDDPIPIAEAFRILAAEHAEGA